MLLWFYLCSVTDQNDPHQVYIRNFSTEFLPYSTSIRFQLDLQNIVKECITLKRYMQNLHIYFIPWKGWHHTKGIVHSRVTRLGNPEQQHAAHTDLMSVF
jgi:hypothetical protein